MRIEIILIWLCYKIIMVFRSQPAKRHSNRKRKANQSQPPVVTSDPRVKEACEILVLLLGVMSEAVLIGQTDGELQMEMAEWAGTMAESSKAATTVSAQV